MIGNEEIHARAARYLRNDPVPPNKAWLKESFQDELPPMYTSPGMRLARFYLDRAVDSVPQPDCIVVCQRWKQVLLQGTVVRTGFMDAEWYTYRGVYVEFEKKLH